jgi:hypothetical protein
MRCLKVKFIEIYCIKIIDFKFNIVLSNLINPFFIQSFSYFHMEFLTKYKFNRVHTYVYPYF